MTEEPTTPTQESTTTTPRNTTTTDTPDPATTTKPMSTPSRAFQIADLSVETDSDQPSVNYILEPAAFYSADAVEREREDSAEEIVVMDVSDIEDSAIQTAIKTAVSEGTWRSNTLPEGLAELVERVDFFTGLSTSDLHTHIGLTLHRLNPDRPPAIEFNASVRDQWVSPDSTGALELSLTNNGQETQEVFSGTVPPFGMVRAKRVEGDRQFLLWRNYVDEGCVNFTDEGLLVCDIGIITEIKPNETISRQYEVLPPATEKHPEYTVPPGSGKYLITDTLSYNKGSNSPSTDLSFEVGFSLELVAENEVPENLTN